MALNTLQIANRLKAAERDGRMSEELALVFGEVEEERLGRLVTREHLELELAKVRAEVDKARAEVDKLRLEMQAKFVKVRLEMEELRVDLKHDLTLRFGGMFAAAVGLLAGLMALFRYIPPG